MLILDAGGFSRRGQVAELKTEYLVRGLSAIGYHVVNLGESDLHLGKDFLARMAATHGIKFITANLFDSKWKPLPFAKPWIVFKPWGNDGPRVGVIGVSSARFSFGRKDEKWWNTTDVTQETKKAVAELQKKASVIVVLAYMSDREAEKLAKAVPGIDVVIAGRATYRMRGPRKVGESILCVNGNQGKYAGDALLQVDSSGRLQVLSGELFPLDKGIADDPTVKQIVSKYKEALRNRAREKLKANR